MSQPVRCDRTSLAAVCNLGSGVQASGPPTILIVDHDEPLRNRLAEYLTCEGFQVCCAAGGASMQQCLHLGWPDLVVLEVTLPGEDGFSICRRLTAPGGPAVILLSATAEEVDCVLGLELGADDYLVKPCSPRELLARIRAVLRRRLRSGVSAEAGRRHRIDGFTLETRHRNLHSPLGAITALSPVEMALLLALAARPRQILSRNELLEATGTAAADVLDRTVYVQVSRLRRKIRESSAMQIIRTIRGSGYTLSAPVTLI